MTRIRSFRKALRQIKSQSTSDQQSGLLLDTLEDRILLSGAFQPTPIADPFAYHAVTFAGMVDRASHVTYLPGELVVAVQLPVARGDASAAVEQIDWSSYLNLDFAQPIRTLMSVDGGDGSSLSLVHLELGDRVQVLQAMSHAYDAPGVFWASPNFYDDTVNPLDYIPNDPLYGSQYHHPLMSNDDAWDITLGDPTIIIGVTDNGVDIDHVDLVANIWVNTGEIAGNGIDDDSNGYIDDVNGWDFINNNNDPNPNSTADDHGTHVSGIAAGRTDNGIGIAGVAGHSTIMPLQFYNGTWNAAEINAAFTYGTDNGGGSSVPATTSMVGLATRCSPQACSTCMTAACSILTRPATTTN